MKKWIVGLILIVTSLFVNQAIGQTYTQTYKDKCTGEIKIATTTMTNGFATVSFYNQVRVFSPMEVMAGAVNIWITATYAAFNTMACPTNVVVQQTVQNTVSQAAAAAAAAASAASASMPIYFSQVHYNSQEVDETDVTMMMKTYNYKMFHDWDEVIRRERDYTTSETHEMLQKREINRNSIYK